MNYYPKPVTKYFIAKILNQMENCFFKMNEIDDKFDIGFFCYIKYNNEKIPSIIINNYQIDSNIINISKNKNDKIKIELGDRKYYEQEYNISILEIKPNQNYNFPFFDIDDDIYLDDSTMYYHKKPIYLIQYKKDNETLVSYNVIKDINNKHIRFFHDSNDQNELSLLFNTSNNKLIGIYNKNFNHLKKGLFMKFIIDEFIQNYKNKSNYINEINMTVNVDKNDINKDIYFLDNYMDIFDKKEHLNELNTKLYIDKKEYIYKKYFKFEKEGKYNIKIKFERNLKDCGYMFAGCKNIISIDLTNFKSENVENMEYMFYNCENLKNINLLSLKTINVNNMNFIFSRCNKIKNLDLSSFATKKNIKMNYIFENSKKLIYFNFYSFKERNKNTLEYKICFVGESGIGTKSSLILRIVKDIFKEDIKSGPGAEFTTIKFELKNGIKITLKLWDTTGQNVFRKINESYMKDSDCIVIGFDITMNNTFDEVKKYWYPTAKKILKTNLIYLVGNKIDIYNNVGVNLEDAKNFAFENILRYFETSCKTRQGIDEFLEDLKNEIIKI